MATATATRAAKSPAETPAAALARIRSGFSQNDVAAVLAFSAAGVDPADIVPRGNVLTFRAWQALGRQVAKGATSVRVGVWIATRGKAADDDDSEAKPGGLRPKTAYLFHESQTIPQDAPKGTRPAAWQNPALVKPGAYPAA